MFRNMVTLILIGFGMQSSLAQAQVDLTLGLDAIEQILDMTQVQEKYDLYYKDFFTDANHWKRKWSYYTSDLDGRLSPFTSDGCSSFPDGTQNKPDLWRDCCIEHDFSYWVGGTHQQKTEADTALGTCVHRALNSAYSDEELSDAFVTVFECAMKSGVCLGGSPNIYSPWRWSYGWNTNRKYRALRPKDKVVALEYLKAYRVQITDSDKPQLTKFGVPVNSERVLQGLLRFEERTLR